MNVFKIVFVFFSKIYISFYNEKGDYWSIFPIVILSTLLTFNLEIISFFLFKINNYQIVGFFVFLIFFFNIIFRNINYEYVKNYTMSRRIKIMISIIILINLIVSFVFLNISRNGRFML